VTVSSRRCAWKPTRRCRARSVDTAAVGDGGESTDSAIKRRSEVMPDSGRSRSRPTRSRRSRALFVPGPCGVGASRCSVVTPCRRARVQRASSRSEVSPCPTTALRSCGNPSKHLRYAVAASTMETTDCVGITRTAFNPEAASSASNSSRLRSRALPNIAIIWMSSK
jgi:hypothetical protein